MDELVAIIEQRNQIVSSLDQDRQRWEGKTIHDGALTCIGLCCKVEIQLCFSNQGKRRG